MGKSLAERAAELGISERRLVSALLLLGRRKTASAGTAHAPSYRGKSYTIRKYTPLFSIEKAAELMGVDLGDAHREIKAREPIVWTEKKVIDAMFAFHKREGHWPTRKHMKLANQLPPRDVWALLSWTAQSWVDTAVRPRDFWERRIAKDKRCTPQMAIGLRNVLARKEAIDRLGFQSFIDSGFATLIQKDGEYGELYQLPGETPKEPMVLLKVVNSTPDPDGTFSDYYLRVPPDMVTVRQALTWTFNGDEALGSQPYNPLVQT